MTNASFRIGALTATGLPGAIVEAVLCTHAVQFPDEPASACDEIRRVREVSGYENRILRSGKEHLL